MLVAVEHVMDGRTVPFMERLVEDCGEGFEGPSWSDGEAPRFTGAWVSWEQPEDESWTVLPDLTDPATIGCLLALVREAYGEWPVVVYIEPFGVNVGRHYDGETLGEALVLALEAAP